MKSFSTACLIFISLAVLSGCKTEDAQNSAETPVRGLKTTVIGELQNSQTRRYPSVLQPSESTSLAFQISGQLMENKLTVGQKVKAGQVLIELDQTALRFTAQEAKAALDEARAAERNARKELERNRELKEKGLIGQATLDNSETNVETLAAKTVQIANKYAVAQDNLVKAQLIAPYDGVINSVAVDSYDNISAGMTIASLYNPSAFEARFSVSYTIASGLAVGKAVTVGVAGYDDIRLPGTVTELASSTDVVSSFPVVVRLDESHPEIKAGMAVDVAIDFQITSGKGYTVPFSAILVDGMRTDAKNLANRDTLQAEVFLFDETSQTVFKQAVMVAGVRENELIVTEGLKPGDRVAVAGVAFLREGQKVKLLETL